MHTLPRIARGAAVLAHVLGLAGAGCATPSRGAEPPQQAQLVRAVSAPQRLEPPAYLPAEARTILRTRMATHAREMADLVSAVMVLRYPEIGQRARTIAEVDRFARPLSGDASELNAALPEQFFVHDQALRSSAHALAGAAERMDARAVASSYGQLSQTCVSCHATYRSGQ